MLNGKISIRTSEHREIVDISEDVDAFVTKHQYHSGICQLTILHTTAALTTADLDLGTDQDMLDAFEIMMPKLRYRHPHDPSHVTEHILSSLIGTSLSIPIDNGKCVLGTWQRIVLVELSGPRSREIVITLI